MISSIYNYQVLPAIYIYLIIHSFYHLSSPSSPLSLSLTFCLFLSLSLLQESFERAKAILKLHAREHKALAEALMKYETLDADDIKAILDGRPVSKDL